MKHGKNTGARYFNPDVQKKQDEIFIGDRKDLVKAVRLPSKIRGVDTYTYIHFVTRGQKDGTTGVEKKRDSGIPGLNIIHPVDKGVPKEVIDVTRGTVVHNLRDVVLKSIETKTSVNLNKLTVKDDRIVISTAFGSNVFFPIETVKLVNYVEGHFLRICFFEKPSFVTSTNLVPEGKYKEVDGKRVELRGPARWGHGTPFMEDVNNILQDTIPDLLSKLYPTGTRWSPWCYPCILVTQERIRATQDYVGKPYLIMLEPQLQWDPEDPPASIANQVKIIQKKPFDLSSLNLPEEVPVEERDKKSYILYKKKGMSVKEANKYLRGNKLVPLLEPMNGDSSLASGKKSPGAYKLCGGGKIIITGPAFRGTTRIERLAFHIESDGWIWREVDVNDPSIYNSFLQQLNDRNWSVGGDNTSLDVIKQKYLPLVLPEDDELAELNVNIKLMKEPTIKLDNEEDYERNISERFDRLVWYNLLVGSNRRHRAMIMLFLKRYAMDLNAAVEWLINLDVATTTFDKDEKIALNKKRFITKLKTSIELTVPVPFGVFFKNPTPLEAVKAKSAKTIIKKPVIGSKLETPREQYFSNVKGMIEKRKQGVSTKLVSIYHDVNGNKFESIRITEPNAKRRVVGENESVSVKEPTAVEDSKISTVMIKESGKKVTKLKDSVKFSKSASINIPEPIKSSRKLNQVEISESSESSSLVSTSSEDFD